jgi:hypothetical protein
MMLFRMVKILFGLFVENNNEELRRMIVISSSSYNNRIVVILTIRNNKRFTFGYTIVIPIPKTAAILLFLAHPNIPERNYKNKTIQEDFIHDELIRQI